MYCVTLTAISGRFCAAQSSGYHPFLLAAKAPLSRLHAWNSYGEIILLSELLSKKIWSNTPAHNIQWSIFRRPHLWFRMNTSHYRKALCNLAVSSASASLLIVRRNVLHHASALAILGIQPPPLRHSFLPWWVLYLSVMQRVLLDIPNAIERHVEKPLT